ncbi:MAG: translation initiation factor IF-2 [Bacteroidota bacterium]|jgi:translation initiation factor IF-2
MADKPPKKKIYQIAKEFNVSHDTLIQYLKKKGHDVKGIMSIATDAMMHDIVDHFKKEKEVAEKHQRKMQAIQDSKKKVESRAEPATEEKTKAKPGRKPKEEAKVKPEVVIAIAKEEPAPVVEQEEPAVQKAVPAPGAAEKTKVVSPVEATSANFQETPQEEKATPAKQKKPGRSKAKEEKVEVMPHLTPKMGLTIKGKIDLEEMSRAHAAIEKPAGAGEKTEEERGAESEPKKRKKKRKRVRSESVPSTSEEVDELLLKAKKKKKLRYNEVDQEEVKEAIRRTLAEMDEATAVAQRAAFKRRRKEKREAEEQKHLERLEKEKSILRVTEYVSVNELATLMHVDVAEVIKKCIELGLMVSINQRLDKDTITLVADEYGYQVEFFSELAQEVLIEDVEDEDETLTSRPPVVTIMGHVDHGKTSLLDYIRRSNVVAGEAGGITQHIGAYSVTLDSGKRITFLDTPGHEAFTAMRARGAQITDIVVLVVAADDSVMPQTVEAISHAQAAGVPIVIAINKCDKPEANPDRIRQQLAEKNVLVEEWGGKYQCVELSARTGNNVGVLLEKILLEADVLDLKANFHREARGVIIEAQVDKGKGIVTTILVQKGTLMIGSSFVAGIQSGRVRAMFDERGKRTEVAKPSTPVQVLGFDGVPQAGDVFVVVEDERKAREISLRRQQLKREQDFRLIRSMTLNDISQKIQEGQVKELKVIVKGDVDGSVGALADSLMKITHAEVRVNVIMSAVGAITESDVLLAAASSAVIIGFHVRPNLNARRLAEQEHVDIRLYNIIYDAIEEVKKALEGLLAPEQREEVTATIDVREVFKIPKVGAIAGCYVQDGKISRGNKVRVVRDGIVVYEGGLSSLKRFKDDVREVESGFECGLGLENFNDIKVGDTVEAYKIVETQRKLV